MPSRTPLLAAILPVLLVCACGSTRGGSDLPRDPSAAEASARAGIEMLDPRTGSEAGAGYLEVTLRNSGGSKVRVRCAPEWLDATGAVVARAEAWQAVELGPGEQRRVRFAPAPEGVRMWRLRFQP
jgi:uncharacterized protein YcfL